MSPATREKAKAKLATLYVGVGYPDHWRDYAALEIRRDDALGNAQRAELFDYRWSLAKLGQPVDKHEWWMTPQTVNAVNLPLQNAMNFPAAILHPPFFFPDGDPVRRTTAPSARSSATRSATASTTRARSSTRTAGWPTGGRPKTSRTSGGGGHGSWPSTTPTSRFPGSTSTGS